MRSVVEGQILYVTDLLSEGIFTKNKIDTLLRKEKNKAVRYVILTVCSWELLKTPPLARRIEEFKKSYKVVVDEMFSNSYGKNTLINYLVFEVR